MTTILVTGATGRVGGQVAAQLRGHDVRVLTPGRQSLDLTDPTTFDFDGVDAVFLVFPTGKAAELIQAIGPRRIVYLSAHGVPDKPDPEARPDGDIMASHAYLESLIAAEGSEHTFLRSSGFAANTLGWAAQLKTSDTLRWIFPELRRALVHEADLAAVAVRALTEDGHPQAYHLTGPEQLTQVEQLAALGAALGRELRFEEVTETDLPPQIVAGQAAMLAHPEPVTTTIAELTGRPARTYAEWARDHVADFRP